jgi:hypothetical protein
MPKIENTRRAGMNIYKSKKKPDARDAENLTAAFERERLFILEVYLHAGRWRIPFNERVYNVYTL